MSVLSTQQLKKEYAGKTIVYSLSVSIASGQIVGLLGPNGAGKTTAFDMISGLIRPNSGKILLNDTDITALPLHERARLGIGYLPQEKSIFRSLSVEKNILAALQISTPDTHKKHLEQLDILLENMHLGHLRNKLGVMLSGGERRRVEIARALASNPEFILLDEPFAGVDPVSIIDIKRVITQLSKKGIGILITDHNVRATLEICDYGYILSEGNVLCEGDANTIQSDSKVQEIYLGKNFIIEKQE